MLRAIARGSWWVVSYPEFCIHAPKSHPKFCAIPLRLPCLDNGVRLSEWAAFPAKLLRRYDGLLDRVAYYFDLPDDVARMTVQAFKTIE